MPTNCGKLTHKETHSFTDNLNWHESGPEPLQAKKIGLFRNVINFSSLLVIQTKRFLAHNWFSSCKKFLAQLVMCGVNRPNVNNVNAVDRIKNFTENVRFSSDEICSSKI